MNKFSGETLGLNQFEEMVFDYGCFGDEMIGYCVLLLASIGVTKEDIAEFKN